MTEQKPIDPTTLWTVLPSSTDWTLDAVSTDGYHGANIKGDGCMHLWEYEHEMLDRTKPAPHREVYGDVASEEYIDDEEAQYRHICDIDEEITRLLALREVAIQHFEAHGIPESRKDWYYGKPLPLLETVPARNPQEQLAIFAAIDAESHQQWIQYYARLGIVEEDIQNFSSIACIDGIYTIKMRDGRTWQKTSEEVDEI